MKILLIVGHPKFKDSIANKRIVERLRASDFEIDVRVLVDLYPDFKIDVEAEQIALTKVDTVIFQYPFWWYNMPGLMKIWFDEVFAHDFAYGSKGNKLKGKNFLLSFTVGGPPSAYQPIGQNHFRIGDFVKPMEQTAYLSQMHFIDPIYEHEMIYIPGVYHTREEVEARADRQAERILLALDKMIRNSF
ncbi:NAD(P)H-dependent oxidoreductase [Halosquirtibacter xylanolyticus]|uniref:NAD(P)H-dependent oxidoreductase n=1 Tax=Halosquirtibacter xylanolyticus TaxID=3374599 RepID=UPI003747B655|nr:NAD(P)H-dependent oxidoreductase [Prolixibacteraceae bacterium]